MSVSEYIRSIINNDLSKETIINNQSYLSDVLDMIIKNIIDEKLDFINKLFKELYLKQEFIIYLIRSKDETKYQELLKDFTTLYEDNLRTTS